LSLTQKLSKKGRFSKVSDITCPAKTSWRGFFSESAGGSMPALYGVGFLQSNPNRFEKHLMEDDSPTIIFFLNPVEDHKNRAWYPTVSKFR